MKLSTRIRYATRFLLHLASHTTANPVAISAIADEECISPKYLEQIVSSLKKAQLVESERGKTGGYRLARTPENINMLEVFRALDEGIELVPCIDEEQCSREKKCVARNFWDQFNSHVEEYLRDTTLAEVIQANPSN